MPKPKAKYVYGKADFAAMRINLVDTNWEEEYIKGNVGTSVEDTLMSKLTDLRNRYVPKKTPSTEPSWRDSNSFPINKSLQDAMRKKKITHCQWIYAETRENCDSARLNYTKARNKVKTMMRQSKRRFEKDIARKSKSSPKAFWAHVRRRLKTRSDVATLLENVKDKDSMKFKDEEKANILENQFSSDFRREPDGEIPTYAINEINMQ